MRSLEELEKAFAVLISISTPPTTFDLLAQGLPHVKDRLSEIAMRQMGGTLAWSKVAT